MVVSCTQYCAGVQCVSPHVTVAPGAAGGGFALQANARRSHAYRMTKPYARLAA